LEKITKQSQLFHHKKSRPHLKLPDFPWDLLAPYGEKAKKYIGGFIDLSQGTPVDPTPKFIQDSLTAASNSPSYPVVAGTKELQDAIRTWSIKHLGVTGEFDVLPSIGSKEFIALLPTFLQSKKVLYPKVAYPTYLVSAMMASAPAIPVEIDASTWPAADLAWLNSPSNPTGQVQSDDQLRACINWVRKNNSIIASDECYLSFADNAKSILALANGDNTGLLAVLSLSKRSNLAGYRAGFVVGDSKLIDQIRQVRKHAGLMVPLPVQQAMITALSDEVHVTEQAARYRARRETLKSALLSQGFRIEHSEAGLYIWCTKGEDGYKTVDYFAQLGILVTPGAFYGSDNFVRIALTATDENIDKAAARIKS
jgi:succinyldiaminopimelate transaminase